MTTVLEGAAHPGTPLRILQSNQGYFLGFLQKPDEEAGEEIGKFLSRESVYFATAQEAAFQLDLLQTGAVPFKFMLKPDGVPESTEVYLNLLTGGGAHPVRQETERSEDFVPPVVTETWAMDVEKVEQQVPDSPIVTTVLRARLEELGIAWTDSMSNAELAELIDDAEAIAEAQAVTPDDDNEADLAPLPGD